MSVLRLRQTSEDGVHHTVSVEFQNGSARRAGERRFEFQLSERDREDIRWYLEDYLQYPFEPAPTIARRIEVRMDEIGDQLFHAVFDGGDLWPEVRKHLSDTRVEIASGVREAAAMPWELLRDPVSRVPLALEARSFVRGTYESARPPRVPENSDGQVRVLLVICRPGGRDDVPFRSVARRLVEGFRGNDAVRLTVLRPPTFTQLARVLRAAKENGEPYHLVHFDGHGAWSEHGPREGGHGYLLFENADVEDNRELIDGPKLGALLAETHAGALVLNACQSAFATPPSAPLPNAPEDVHEAIRSMGSLAQEVMDAGAASVVAMRYSVFVDTAAVFMADLYQRLVQGATVGEAVSFGRKQLQARQRPLRDWSVPVIFEAADFALFPKQKKGVPELRLQAPSATGIEGLPARPDAGFFGRDETLLALDRAFDRQKIVLLHAYAGSGKTTAVAEFARWYKETGGIDGPVLFTSFERHLPLARVLDQIGQKFGPALERAGVNWPAKNPPERREIALSVLTRIPVLWIWDNVEPVAGFPKGAESMWTAEEQRELADFLRAARDTEAKFLLTSRREERDWLRDLPARIPLPPMPFHERLELARALAEKHGHRLAEVEDWRPLLNFTQGNPLTITALVGQALRDRLRTRKQIEGFVDRLRQGEAAFEDEASEGRTRSLGASLNYGFEHAFTETERSQLALLRLFRGFVDVDALCLMGDPEADWCLPEVRGLTREGGIRLLDRAAEAGLLVAGRGGYYGIHPALPWFFRKCFEERDADARQRATLAFVEAIGDLGTFYHRQYEDGNRGVIDALRAEEPNLLHARALARRNGWLGRVISSMQGLQQLYYHTGRNAEWKRLVEEIVPEFIDPATDGPLAGRDDDWSLVTGYRVELAIEVRGWSDAKRLQRLRVDWNRQHSREDQPNTLRRLAISLQALGDIQRETGNEECLNSFKESYEIVLRIGDNSTAAVTAFNLGHAYLTASNLQQAEQWYQKSLGLRAEKDNLGRAGCLGQLGHVAYERFLNGRNQGQLRKAAQRYHESLELTPADAIDQLAAIHNQLGAIYNCAGQPDRALYHYRESIRFKESAVDRFGAAQTRYNVAIVLGQRGSFDDAREYARAALRDFQTYGAGAAKQVQLTLDLIARIDKAAATPKPPIA